MLNRFVAMKAAERKLLQPEKRPFNIHECSDVAKAQHWRENVISEIAHKTGMIQDSLIYLFIISFFNYNTKLVLVSIRFVI
jgi:hypothetical protein